MVEFMNLAVMAEVPLVVINSQRGGPSTGLPTKTEQSDLNLAAFGGSGDSPRAVLAPANVQECYELVVKAFEVAEGFQTPVIVLIDFFLSNRMEDVAWSAVAPDRFGEYPQVLAEPGPEPYRRFTPTETGISPRAVPGMDGLFHAVTGLEHDESGFPNYSADVHETMTKKRYGKMETLARTWPPPEVVGPAGDLDVGIVSWGSTIGAAMEAIHTLEDQGIKAGGFFPRLMWPVQAESLRVFSERSRLLVVAETNYTGQYANIVERLVHRDITRACQVRAEPLPVADIEAAALGGGR